MLKFTLNAVEANKKKGKEGNKNRKKKTETENKTENENLAAIIHAHTLAHAHTHTLLAKVYARRGNSCQLWLQQLQPQLQFLVNWQTVPAAETIPSSQFPVRGML